jgi:hypothetical protein
MRLCYSPTCTYCNQTFMLMKKIVFPAYDSLCVYVCFMNVICGYVCCRCELDSICREQIDFTICL